MSSLIQKSIAITAPVAKAWEVFTNPVLTRKMGGEYVSDWKPGSFFGWKGADGILHTQGTVISVEPQKLLKHSLFDSKNSNAILSVITYRFSAIKEGTVIDAEEQLNYDTTQEQLKEIAAGWDAALNAVKKVAEES